MLNVLNVGSVLLVIYELQYDCVNWSQVLFPFLEFWIIWAGRCLTDRCYCNILIQERRLRIDRLKMLLIDRNDSMYKFVSCVCFMSLYFELVARRRRWFWWVGEKNSFLGLNSNSKLPLIFQSLGAEESIKSFSSPLCVVVLFSPSHFSSQISNSNYTSINPSITYSCIYHTPLYNETDWLTVVGWHSTHSDKECHLEASLLQHTTEQTL